MPYSLYQAAEKDFRKSRGKITYSCVPCNGPSVKEQPHLKGRVPLGD